MNSRAVIRKLKALEQGFRAELADDWTDLVMWNVTHRGIFGHSHHRYSPRRKQTERIPCSDDEEVAIMREKYESDGYKLSTWGEKVSFSEFLQHYCYLGPYELEPRRQMIIERLKAEENGKRVDGSSC